MAIKYYEGNAGMIINQCPLCGVTDLHSAIVAVPANLNEEEVAAFVTVDNASKFACTVCQGEWSSKTKMSKSIVKLLSVSLDIEKQPAVKGGNRISTAEQDKLYMSEIVSKLPPFTPEFERVFFGRDKFIQDMFLDLAYKFITYPIKRYTTRKPDYSMQNNTVFCCIFLQVKCLMIHIKINHHKMTSRSLHILEHKDASKSGKIPYVKFRVTDKNQINEAFRLINAAYKFDS